jgi:hypothetical protein
LKIEELSGGLSWKAAGILDVNAGKPAGGFVRRDKKYHCRKGPPGGLLRQNKYCQTVLFYNKYIVKTTTKGNLKHYPLKTNKIEHQSAPGALWKKLPPVSAQ